MGPQNPQGEALGEQPRLSEPRVHAVKDSSLVPELLNLEEGQVKTG